MHRTAKNLDYSKPEKEHICRIYIIWFQDLLQMYSNKKSMVLAKPEKNRSMG